MKLKADAIGRRLDKPDDQIRLYVLHGQDDAGARALAGRLEAAMGTDAERIDLDGTTLREDPARLADEAAAISLFGGRRWIRVQGGDECCDAISALLDAPVAGNPVVLIAGVLKATGALLKRAGDDPAVLTCQLYRPDSKDLADVAEGLARPLGIRLGRGVAATLAANGLHDRAVIERELEKIALYLDAAPDRPREADLDTLAMISATLDEADPAKLVEAVLGGDLRATDSEIETLETSGAMIPALRALSRRLVLLARLRAEVDGGKNSDAVIAAQGKSIFWKEINSFKSQLRHWPATRIAIAQERVFAGEGAIMASRTAGDVLGAQVLVDIARVGERLR